MLEPLVVIGALVLGGVVGCLATRGVLAARAAAEYQTLQARLVTAETLQDEARKQLTHRELEVGELRTALEAERALRVQADTRWEAARTSLEEQRRLVDEARERLGDTFKALGAETLQQTAKALLESATTAIDAQLVRRQEAVEGTVRPLAQALERYETEIRALETARQQAYGSLEQQLRTLATSSADLQRETGNLVTALRASDVRGRWGEITLHRVVELAGMAEHCDYVEQQTVDAEGSRLRPDMIVRLPAGREIVVDAKVPLTGYLDAMAAKSPEERAAAFARHAQQVRQHMAVLAGKAYWEQCAGAAELVVMFIPGEAFVAAAVEADPTLIEDGMARRVVVATPTTLVALLRAIAYGWRQERLAENAAQISELGRQLYERIRTMTEHVNGVGDALGKATVAFNRAVGSLESRVLPAARRFRDLGAATGPDVATLVPVDPQPRTLELPDA